MSEYPRFPAEWEPQSAVLMAWPHADTDWSERLTDTSRCFANICSAISLRQKLLLMVPDIDIEQKARDFLEIAKSRFENIQFVHLNYDDTWLRDSGPITLLIEDGFRMLDFHFTAWGGKFEAGLDDKIVAELIRQGLFAQARHQRIDFALEGGGIETDGQGTLLTTWHCLHERHASLSRPEIESVLKSNLHQHRILWLQNGYLEGDDTDAHIDTLARFATPESIVFQGCQDTNDSHYTALNAMAGELGEFRQSNGEPYRLFELPWPQPIIDKGRRLAASYANFLIINGAVLMPLYGDAADDAAMTVMRQAFAGREIVGIPCRDLIWQNGSLHCCTMQLPEGLLK